MNKQEASIIAKVATGPWSKEFTPELGLAFFLALENYDYADAMTAISALMKQPDRNFAPNPGEIVGQIKSKNSNNPARRYWSAKDQTTEQGQSIEQRQAVIAEQRAKYPDLFTSSGSSKVQQKGFDEGCSD